MDVYAKHRFQVHSCPQCANVARSNGERKRINISLTYNLKVMHPKLVDMKLAGDVDEVTDNDAFNDTQGKIIAIKKDLERLKEDKAKSDDMKANVDSIAFLIKAGNEIKEFNRYLFERTVDKVIVGEGDDPYKVKFFLKTKQQYQISAQKYILNRKAKTVIDGIAYQHNQNDVENETNENESNTCRIDCVAKKEIEPKNDKK